MTEPIIVRASQVDVVERCNGAAYGLSVQGESDPSATEGTLVHAALARYAIARRDGIALDQDSFDLPGDAQMLFERGAAFIDKLNLTGARIERRMEATMFGIHWSAQPDLVTDYQHIIDHKCDLDPESTHHGQMKMAAFLDHVRVHSNPDLTRYLPPKWRCTTVYLRDDSADDGYYTPAELWAWAEALAAKVHSPIAYTIGAHCRYCAKRVGCPGHTASLTTLVATPEGTLVSDDDLVRIYPLLTQYEATLKVARATFKARAQAAPGQCITTPEGTLRIKQVRRDTIDPAAAWSHIVAAVPTDVLPSVLAIRKGPLEDALKATAPRGQKAETVMAFMGTLRATGAITADYSDVLEFKATKAIEAGEEAV